MGVLLILADFRYKKTDNCRFLHSPKRYNVFKKLNVPTVKVEQYKTKSYKALIAAFKRLLLRAALFL